VVSDTAVIRVPRIAVGHAIAIAAR
jgi:hypothetical protein